MEERHVRILIVDDHAMVASALAVALAQERSMSVVAIAQSVADVEAMSGRLPDQEGGIDVAVVDYYLPDGTGVDVAFLIAQRQPHARVVMMSAESSPEHLRRAIEAGCVAFVNKTSPLEDLVRAVAGAARGEASFDAVALQTALSPSAAGAAAADPGSLSDREQQVLSMLAAGLSTEVMAVELYLSQHTVRNHVRSLTAKLGAHSRLEAVAIAARAGLITLVAPTR